MFSLIIVFILQSPSVHFRSSLLFLWSQLKEEVVRFGNRFGKPKGPRSYPESWI
uniref:Uncharacterized protein n=1 Tax=Xiphophorus maculatus TaxID=8083 RepID=A0A3B5R1Q5_XIPMA